MIGRLRGNLIVKRPPHLLLEVAGLAYEIEAPMTTFYQLPEIGQPVTLYTHLLVLDKALLLYGFAHEEQLRLFRSLLRVSGVGARTALAILSGMDNDEFIERVCAGDVARLSAVPGIGKKTAERLIVELRDRLLSEGERRRDPARPGAPTRALDDAVQALITLGYPPRQAQRFAQQAARPDLGSVDIIRAALKLLQRP